MNDFEFKDYCRPIFSQLREWFGVKPQTYLVKLCGGFNLLEFISNSKSGQFFFYSHDGQFLIKSMTRSECKLMRSILPDYYYYVKNQPSTLLTKFYGMYRVTTHHRQPIYFIVMGSVFYTQLDIHRIYDLKGSTYGRRATELEKQAETPVLKDLDFIEYKEKLKIGSQKAKLFKEQLRRDTVLLNKLDIMDYSLLIGIHYRSVGDRGHINRNRCTTSYGSTDLADMLATEDVHNINIDIIDDVHESKPLEIAQSLNVMQISPNKSPKLIKPSVLKIEITHALQVPLSQSMSADQSMTESNSEASIDDESGDGERKISRPASPFSLSSPGLLKRLPSRRLSQIGSMKGSYVVKTPLEKHFDIPELVEVVDFDSRMNKFYHDDDDDDNEYRNIFEEKEHGGMSYVDEEGNIGDQIYFCGIIDILQKYNKRKKVENFFRGLKNDTSTISSVPPTQYSKRMYNFLKDNIL